MRLNELVTPFERRRVIEYGSDGNKVVRHWYEMQHVIGPLYMSRITKNEYESDMFTLFVFFPGVPNGFTYWEDTWHPEQYTTEHVLRSLKHDGYASQEQLIATLNLHVEKDIFISDAKGQRSLYVGNFSRYFYQEQLGFGFAELHTA